MVVEDDEDLRAYIAEMLRGLGYQILAVGTAAAAVQIIEQSRRIDLLLTDVVMPELNGWELGKLALSTRPELKVLYMSGYPRNAVISHGRLDEGVELLQKPISQAQLAACIRGLLSGRENG